ncbi:AlpA family phage regulatory protein [Salmonella enterica subsp. enterica]|nr:AlpA family phage regulatory protein [Salmonella enterica subsp. enterica serovar Javiana]
MPVSDTVHERFIRLPEVMHLCGLSRSTIYDLISREAFPKQISLGGKNVAWAQSEVTAWMTARALLQSQQNSDEALSIKRDADPTFDFCGYLEMLPQTNGMFMGNASIIPRNYRKYLYHAYLAYMEANGYRNVLSLKMFGLGLPMMLKEYGLNYEKRHTKQGIQTNLSLKEESYGDWLPKCDDPAAT